MREYLFIQSMYKSVLLLQLSSLVIFLQQMLSDNSKSNCVNIVRSKQFSCYHTFKFVTNNLFDKVNVKFASID